MSTTGPLARAHRRAPRAKTAVEHQIPRLGEVAEQFLVGAAAAGVSKLPTELAQLLTLHAAHGHDALIAALARAVALGRWRAGDVRSTSLAYSGLPHPTTWEETITSNDPISAPEPTVPLRSLVGLRPLSFLHALITVDQLRPQRGNRPCLSQVTELRGPVHISSPITVNSLMG
jgi:hypothetical protein